MKHILIFLLIITLSGCHHSKRTTASDFATLQRILDTNPPTEIISTGPMGDFTVYVPETDELKEIMTKTNSAQQFLSADFNPTTDVKSGLCIINVISGTVLENQKIPRKKCFYRLYCGNSDIDTNTLYAIEVCKD